MPTLAGVSGHSFQSTLPLRGATRRRRASRPTECYFNPHSPCGERPGNEQGQETSGKFQSTLPLRGATPPLRLSSSCA